MAKLLKNGPIDLDTTQGKRWCFVSKLFNGYLWGQGKEVTISFIMSKQPGKGHFSKLLNRILRDGYDVLVPTPSMQMQTILGAKGFGWQARNVELPLDSEGRRHYTTVHYMVMTSKEYLKKYPTEKLLARGKPLPCSN